MADAPDTSLPLGRDYRDTVFLPKTDFPMKAGLAAKEPAILARWEADDLYGKLRAARAGRERFILHDGPPYANGQIHMGHAMMKTLKDFIVRSQSLLGKDAPFIPGWDCHGLPIEWKIEEAYRAKKRSKDEVPPAEFRAECRAYAAQWVDVQRAQFKRLGVIGDWADPYLTMNYASEAVIAGELLKFAESGQLYRGAKPVMWSPVEKTALAEAEVEYEDVVSTQIDVAFEIVEAPNAPELVGAHAVVWTTTPWTIPVNQAIAYGKEIEYTIVEFIGTTGEVKPGSEAFIGKRFVVAEDLIESFVTRVGLLVTEEHGPFGASWFEGATARHPMWRIYNPPRDGEGDHAQHGGGGEPQAASPADSPLRQPSAATSPSRGGFFSRPRPFLPGDFVTTDAGTGLVHMAPDHGEDDFLLCKAHGIDPVFAVDGAGFYRADWAWLGGQGSVINKKFVAPDGPICADLRAAGALLAASEDYAHSYPHSWRSKAKVIFRATPQWFIGMDKSLSQREREGADEVGGRVRAIAAQASPSPSHPAAPGGPLPLPMGEGNGATLRELALDAIEHTRWVPAKSRNRIHAMVEGRPDWVISRQRAWGVPIALYVNRATGDYLADPAVNARIVAAFREGGADAWYAADHQALLGPDYTLADWEPQQDILDVWFDSGSTHAFVVEARYGEGVRANLYCEGSDQHRGWFQSSLLESCGTRGRAPFDAVLTHGFVLDENGRKMSKSIGNVLDPIKVIGESGADILRLWVAQTDYFDDVRIGKAILAGTGDAYRKLRNTFRYLLGALDGWDEGERVAPADMPELERYVLHLLAELDAELLSATHAFEFNRYARALTDFCNEDLSAFFFDIRKDVLYCDAPDSATRRAYRTVLDTLFHALVRYAAPILCFTAEEVWGTRFPDAESVHLLEWPALPLDRQASPARHPSESWGRSEEPESFAASDPGLRWDDGLVRRWTEVRRLREAVTEAIEPLRREKTVRSSLEAEVTVPALPLPAEMLEEMFIVAQVRQGEEIAVTRTDNHKCGRCWRHRPEVAADGALCDRCAEVVA